MFGQAFLYETVDREDRCPRLDGIYVQNPLNRHISICCPLYRAVRSNGMFTRSSKRPAIHEYFEYICWKFAGRLLDRVNTL